MNNLAASLLCRTSAAVIVTACAAIPAWAQSASDNVTQGEEIVVVGSQIVGGRSSGLLPVTVVDAEQIAGSAAVSGDELLRELPQMGDSAFNPTYLPGSSNSARGDTGSINLRNIGEGNTLTLINGRRMVYHPTTQGNADGVQVMTFNSNAIPVTGLSRLEILRDGAGAIYGSDAVAGVLNIVMRDDYEGLSLEARQGGAEGTSFREFNASATFGSPFAGGRGRFSVFANYDYRSGMDAADQDYTASSDIRPLFVGTAFEDFASLDGRSGSMPWGSFTVLGDRAVRLNGSTTNITDSVGRFHIQPNANAGCRATPPGTTGICIDDGSAQTASADRNLRNDTSRAYNDTLIPRVKRGSIFGAWSYDISSDVQIFGEASLYKANSWSRQKPSQMSSSVPITIPAANYYNPFGALRLPNGSLNPNRIANLNIPAGGLDVILRTYTFSDLEREIVEVDNTQYRFLGGVRFETLGLSWESAVLYSAARSHDRQDAVSATKLQRQLGLATPDAYNPFNGGSLTDFSLGDPTPSSAAALDAIRIKVHRISETTLALADIKASTPALFSVPGGDVGFAFGVEVRRETISDDRDSHADGTLKFTDSITGVTYDADLISTSPTPDTRGSRMVASTWMEFSVPLVSPDMNIPLVRNLDLQLAGRAESYSDFGTVAKPKAALAWDVLSGLRLRGSYAESFKATNLYQANAGDIIRSASRTDWIYCEADYRANRIADFTACTRSQAVQGQRQGNPDLKPETSNSYGFGIVLNPTFLHSALRNLTITADYWNIKQRNVVGLYGEGNALVLDYLLRLQGSSNPNVIRETPSPSDIANFDGTGLAPVGRVSFVTDQYDNLQPQAASGWDFALNYRLRNTPIGSFSFALNVAYLATFDRDVSPAHAPLFEARDSGVIPAAINLTGGGSLLRRNRNPQWRGNGSITWRYGQFQIGAYSSHTGSVNDYELLDTDGAPWLVDSRQTFNLYGQVTVGKRDERNLSLRVGVRNMFDKDPPLSSSGYIGRMYHPYARYWYSSAKVTF